VIAHAVEPPVTSPGFGLVQLRRAGEPADTADRFSIRSPRNQAG